MNSTQIRGRPIRRIHLFSQAGGSVLSFLKRQIIGLFSLIIAIILSIPGVPGPGFIFFGLALLLLEFPGKKGLFLTLKDKRHFRIVRVLLWKKLTVFVVLPRHASNPQERA
ncbi:MAG: hypothetical protein HQL72_03235 [Magnetococcales bacterium]|nr:hypothetical protein [Magnetococcales bacterium]